MAFRTLIPMALIAATLVSTAVPRAQAQDSGVALEVVAGKLLPGVSVEDHENADQAVAQMIAKQPGFISRETGAGQDGEWFTIVHWASLRDAENAAAVFMQSAEGRTSMALSDPNSIFFKHYLASE